MINTTTLTDFNALSDADAHALMLRCCASKKWAAMMVAARPFHSLSELTDDADMHWRAMNETDYLEAFAAHAIIGRPDSRDAVASKEQAGVADASAQIRDSLAAYNVAYQNQFGFIFMICASGKSATEMLRNLRARIGNTRAEEVANAAEEQRKITRLRLLKFFAET